MRKKLWITGFIAAAMLMTIPLLSSFCSDPVVRAITSPEGGNSTEYSYYMIYDNGQKKKTNSFPAGRIERYDEMYYCHTPSNAEIKAELADTANRLYLGEIVYPAVTIEAIKAAAAEEPRLHHDLCLFDILQSGDAFFLVAKTNVNWSSPCHLYYWEPASQSLKYLCSWDSVDIVGIAMP